MTPRPSSNKPAWVQLYEARRVEVEVESRPPGRPFFLVPRRKIGLTLSQGEIQEIEDWQERFSKLLNRKISAGETVGILTRMATARYTKLAGKGVDPDNLLEMVEKMVG
jgi:hypothetical protein